MLIEDENQLRNWIAKDVEKLSDAESEALAKYVIALLKKPLADTDLEELCMDKLQVFLQNHTKGFVERLFDCMKKHSYLAAGQSQPQPSASSIQHHRQSEDILLSGGEDEGDGQGEEDEDIEEEEDDQQSDAEGDEDDEAEEEEPAQKPKVKSVVSTVQTKSTTQSAGKSTTVGARSTSMAQKRDIGGEHRSKTTTSGTTSASALGRRRISPPPTATTDAKRARYSNNAADRAISPIRSGGGSVGRRGGGNNGGGGGGRYGGGGRRRSRSPRSRSRSPHRKEHASSNSARRHQCRDFHEKGFCMRGDKCPYDHGLDPVVVEDSALEKIVRGGGGGGYTAYNPPPPGMEKSYIGTSEAYNPEAPALTTPGSTASIGKLDFSVPPPPLPLHIAAGLSGPPPSLISIQTGGAFPTVGGFSGGVVGMPAYQPSAIQPTPFGQLPQHQQQQFGGGGYSRGRGMTMGGPRMMGGERFRPYLLASRTNPALCSLLVKKIPPEQNKIFLLDAHFGKFGQITNLHVQYDGLPDTALVTYKTRREAMNAYKSTEPILNNRFIKVFWQTQPDDQPGGAGELPPETEDSTTNPAIEMEAYKPPQPTDLNRPFSKTFGAAGPQPTIPLAQPKEEVMERKPEKPEAIVKEESAEEQVAEVPAVPTAPAAPQRPVYNPRLIAARRQTDKESLIKLFEVQRRKTELYRKVIEQQRSLLQKIQSSAEKEVKLKLMALVKQIDKNVKTLKSELEEVGTQCKVIQQRLQQTERKRKNSSVRLSGGESGIEGGEKSEGSGETDGGSSGGEANGSDSSKVSPNKSMSSSNLHESISRSMSIEDKKKLFRIVHVFNCPVSHKEELIAHMEHFGDLFDFDITSRTGPCIFTYKQQADAQTAVGEAASSFSLAPIKVTWAPASLGQETVVPDGERQPDEQVTPAALLASTFDYEDDEEEDDEDDEKELANDDESKESPEEDDVESK